MKKQLIVLGISGVLLTAGLVGAQQSGGTDSETQAAGIESAETNTAAAERAAMLAHGLLRRPLDMGSTLTVTFYDGDPEAGGTKLQSLEFVYGEDSEAAFAEALETAAAEAAYVTVTTNPQTETYDLTDGPLAQSGRFGSLPFREEGFGGRGPGGGFGVGFGSGFGGGHH